MNVDGSVPQSTYTVNTQCPKPIFLVRYLSDLLTETAVPEAFVAHTTLGYKAATPASLGVREGATADRIGDGVLAISCLGVAIGGSGLFVDCYGYNRFQGLVYYEMEHGLCACMCCNMKEGGSREQGNK